MDRDFFRKVGLIYATILTVLTVIVVCVESYKFHDYHMTTMPHDILWEEVTVVEEEPIEIFVPSEVPLVRTTEFVNLTFEEMDFLQQIAMAEARGEDEVGQALVMLTVLNRSEKTGMSIQQVFYARGQFTTVNDPMFGHYVPNENCNKALAMILDGWDEKDFDPEWDTNEKVYYFGVGWSAYGNRGFQYGGHCFNTTTVKEN